MPSWGKIYHHQGNRWVIRLPGGIRIFCDKDHKTFYSREHAEHTLFGIHRELQDGSFDADFYAKRKKSLYSFSVYAKEWLSNCERRVQRNELSPTYLGSLKNYINNIFVPFFGDTSLQEIRGRHVKQFYLSLNYSPKSLWNIMAALHKLFRDAVDEEVISSLPKFPMEFKASTLPEPQWKWASEELQEAVFEHLDPAAYFMIHFLASHGCRPGEGRALWHSDIDLANDTVTIQRAFADNVLRPFTKSKRTRVLPLDLEWKQMYLARPRPLNPDAFVFTDGAGNPHGRNWARNQWNQAVKEAGIAHITLYGATRHSIASQCAARGVPIYLISKFLGHSTLEQTKRYAHLEVNALRQVHRQAAVLPLKKSDRTR